MSVLILMYHGVEGRDGPLFVTPRLFAAHLDEIVASRVPVLTMAEVANLLSADRLPERAVAITFDDAFESVVREAAPLLMERTLRATVYCVGGRLGGTNEWSTARPGAPVVRLATAADLRTLADTGIEIGAHGMDHAPLHTRDAREIRREVHESRARLEDLVGHPVRSFAYPYGVLPSTSAEAAVRTSYATACTTRIGRVNARSDAHLLPRVDAHYVRSPRLIRAVVSGRANAYLALRRVAANARRRVRQDYASPAGGSGRP